MVEISPIRKMELHEVIAKLEQMEIKDVGLSLFWLAGFMSEQDRELWDKFTEGIQESPYYPPERRYTMKFVEICHHLVMLHLHKNQHFTPPELEAVAGALDRLLPLLTQVELDSIPHASLRVSCLFPFRKRLIP